jgi:cytochrome c
MIGRGFLPAAVICLASAATVAAAQGPGDAEAGRQAFAVCGVCHTVASGGAALIGPNLWGVVDREVGSLPGFDYSVELKSAGGTWTPERLDRFLTDPAAFAPGTRMGYAGVADPVVRAALIAYLATLHEGAAPPVAAAPPPDFGPDWPAGPGQVEAGALCNACHSLAIVKQQRLSRDVWDKLLDWMVAEQGMAEQTPERRQLILDYLAAHFGTPSVAQ